MPSPTESQKETARVEAFSDGVFAIAITLLVLDLKVPRNLGPDTILEVELFRQWPTYLAFLSSFAMIGVMWINHHRLFSMITRVDHMLLIYNGLLLLGVTITPFPTALIAAHLEGPDAQTAALVYTGMWVCIAIAFNLLWQHVHRWGKLLGRHVSPEEVRAVSFAYSFGVPVYLIAFVAAFYNQRAAVGITAGLALFFALPQKLFTRARR